MIEMEKIIMEKRKTVAVIIDTLDGVYQTSISNALIQSGNKRNTNLLFFSGMSVLSYHNLTSFHNAIFKLINPTEVDGIILIISSMEIYVGHEGVQKLADTFNIPKVSLSTKINGAVNILVDNYKNMYSLTKHMLTQHSFKRVGYISGPLKNEEAKIRYQGFTQCLHDLNESFDEKFFYEGSFLNIDGRFAIDFFLKENNELPDVLICANDEMAVGAYMRLKELNYSIPQDIAISGYDDIEASSLMQPSLTTLSQPLSAMTDLAIEFIEELIEGRIVNEDNYIPGTLNIRESCGCIDFPAMTATFELDTREVEDLVLDYLNPQKWYYEEVKESIQSLIKYLFDDLAHLNVASEFAQKYNKWMYHVLIDYHTNCDWFMLSLHLRDIIRSKYSTPENKAYIENLFIQIIQINYANLIRKTSLSNYKFKEIYVNSRQVFALFNDARSYMDIEIALKTASTFFDIKEYYLCLYDRPEAFLEDELSLPESITLIAGKNESDYYKNILFKTSEILPDIMLRSHTIHHLVFLSIFFGDIHYGYIVFSMSGVNTLIYETLRSEISNSLKNLILMESKVATEKKLEETMIQLELSNKKLHELSIKDELTGLYNRRGFYQSINHLKSERGLNNYNLKLIFGDLDGLKIINDTFGHSEGNDALCAISNVLKDSIHSDDLLARMSGDEFAICVYRDVTKEDLLKMMDTVRQKLITHNSQSLKPYNVSISLGLAYNDQYTNRNLDELISYADERLYEEKLHKTKDIVK